MNVSEWLARLFDAPAGGPGGMGTMANNPELGGNAAGRMRNGGMGGGSALAADAAPDSWASFMGGKGLSPDNPLVTGGLGLGLGLLRGAQPGGGGLGGALGAGLGGLGQGLLTSHMMKQRGKEDGELTGLLAGFMPKSPGEVAAPPVAGSPPNPSPSASMNGAPPTAGMPPMPGASGPHPREHAPMAPMAESPPIRMTELPPPPMGNGRPMAPPASTPAGPPPMPMSRPPMPQLPMPGLGAPPPSQVGGMMLDAHMGNPGIGGPRMGPTVPMAGMSDMFRPRPQPASMGGGMPNAYQPGMNSVDRGMVAPMGARGGVDPNMPNPGMSMSPNDLMRLPPEVRARFFSGQFGGMF